MRIKIKVIFISAILLMVIFHFGKMLVELSISMKDDLPSTHELPKEYETLFNDSAMSHTHTEVTYNSKKRPPVSLVKYDSLYSIIVCKMETSGNWASEFVSLKEKSSQQSPSVVYNGINDNFYFYYNSGKSKPAKSLTLFLNADSIINLKHSDSLIAYYADFRDFSLSYTESKIKDIYAVNDETVYRPPLKPAMLLFIKKQKKVYFMVITAFGKNKLTKDLLYFLLR